MKEILFNLLFLLVILLITQHILEVNKKIFTKKQTALSIFFSSAAAIIFCMTFPFTVSEQFHNDLRVVPFVIGTLYGGPIVSVGLYIIIVVYRLFIGSGFDLGFFGAILNYGFVTILCCLFYKRFIHSRTKGKMLLSIFIVFLHLIVTRFIYTYIFVSPLTLELFLEVSFIKIITITLFILSIDRIHQNHLLRNKMEPIEKMEMVSHLSASISHEVRNGLTGAQGFLQLLKERETDLDKSKYIHIALEELARTEDIIRDFLTFAKPAPEKTEPVNMEHLIDNTLEIITSHANMNSIEIQSNLSPFWINGDKKLLQQAFLNIFKNAIEAMPNGGRLEVVMHSSQNEGIIMIKDTGIGMNSEQIERLGIPYFTTKGQHGTGLGMMVSLRVIEKVNGKVEIASQERKGTTFTIRFPILIELNN